MSNKHELKVWPKFFKPLWKGTKNFEVRRNDRNYQVGDMLVLLEWDVVKDEWTGSGICKRVTYILDEPAFVKEGYVIMGLDEWAPKEGADKHE
jgi:1-acyl-sn-glycerol-3-phosphate acyltransferase